MASKRKSAWGKTENMKEMSVVNLIDEVAEFEDFKQKILPAIRKDLRAGMSEKDLREKYSAYVQADVLSTALVDPNSAVRLAASKDVLDRKEGKAKENKEVTHRYGNLTDAQLKAILNSEEADLENE